MTIPAVSPNERVREAVLSTLTSYLAVEIGLINVESGGDVTLPTPVSIERFEQVESGYDHVFEVVPRNWNTSTLGSTNETAQGRLTTSIDVDVAFVISRDGEWSDAEFTRVFDRLAAAAARVLLLKYPQLGDSDHVLDTEGNGELRYEVDPDRDPSGQRLLRGVVPFRVRIQERLS